MNNNITNDWEGNVVRTNIQYKIQITCDKQGFD